jgi:hypothetical protein
MTMARVEAFGVMRVGGLAGRFAALLAVALAAASCSSDDGGAGPAGPAKSDAVTSDGPTAPKDAQWTILCLTLSGPDHIERGRALKAQLTKDTPLRDWYLVHRETETDLCYGYYRSFKAGEPGGDRAQRDRLQIDGITDQNGDRPFAWAIFVALTTADPPAPPEWELRNAKGFWTIEIASYTGHAMRKQYAIDAVREARARGVEAYFYHGPTSSSICIGSWPEQAVEEVQIGSSDPRGSDEVIVVVPQGRKVPEDFTDERGRRVRHVQQKLQIVDPSMAAVKKQYPDHPVNGSLMLTKRRDPRTGKPVESIDKSFIVRIPRQPHGESLPPQGTPPPADDLWSTPGLSPGAGQLP